MSALVRKYFGVPVFLFAGILFLTGVALADEIELTASVDKNVVSLDDQLQLQVTVSGSVGSLPSIKLPALTDFNVYSAGSSQNVSFVNGQVSSSVTYTYVLAPKSMGKFTIPALVLNYKGKAYSTSPIQIEVAKQTSKSSDTAKERAAEPREHGKRDVFVDAIADKKQAYVNEQITYTFRFYRRIQLLSNPEYSAPDFTGLWAEDLPPVRQSYVTLDGKRYNVSELKTALFPIQSGKYTIKGARLKCNIQDFDKGNAFDDFFSDFFSRGKTKVLETEPITIEVKPLPEEGKPADFEGAVGNYTITASVDKTSGKAYEPITLKVTISGTGNIKTIPKLNLPALAGFKKYEPVSSVNISKEQDKVRGSQVYTTIIVPQTAGKLVVPEINFCFFDPSSKSYKRINTSAIHLNIEPGKKEDSVSMGLPETSVGTKILGKDIRHIKTVANLSVKQKPLYKNRVFLVFQFLPILALAGTWQYQRYKEKLSQNVTLTKKKRSYGKAIKQLKHAENLLNSSKTKEFSSVLSNAMIGFIADKLGLLPAGLTIKQIESELAQKNTDKELVSSVSQLLEQLDFIRFAPSSGHKEMGKLFDSSKTILKRLEQCL